ADAITVDMARKAARQLHADVVKGINPSDEKRKRKAADAGDDLFEAVAKRYMEWQRTRVRKNKPVAGLKPRTREELERRLFTHCKPFHGMALRSITRRQIATRLDQIAADSGPRAAELVRSALSSMSNYAIQCGYLERNEAAFAPKREQNDRTRVLAPFGLNDEQKAKLRGKPEVAVLWNALPQSDYGDILKLLLLTGCRRDEIGRLKWSEINDDVTCITLPAGIERTKNWGEHRVPLSA